MKPVAPIEAAHDSMPASHVSPVACSMSAAMPSKAIVEYLDADPAEKSRPRAVSSVRCGTAVSSGGSEMPDEWLPRCHNRTTSSRSRPKPGTASASGVFGVSRPRSIARVAVMPVRVFVIENRG